MVVHEFLRMSRCHDYLRLIFQQFDKFRAFQAGNVDVEKYEVRLLFLDLNTRIHCVGLHANNLNVPNLF